MACDTEGVDVMGGEEDIGRCEHCGRYECDDDCALACAKKGGPVELKKRTPIGRISYHAGFLNLHAQAWQANELLAHTTALVSACEEAEREAQTPRVVGPFDEALRTCLQELWALRDNMTNTQNRCKELLEENRRLKKASTDDYTEKYYVKARVYGAIAAKYHETLQSIASNSCCTPCQEAKLVAQAALDWRHSNKGGVPVSEIQEMDEFLMAKAGR